MDFGVWTFKADMIENVVMHVTSILIIDIDNFLER